MIYVDHNAGAPLRPEVAALLQRSFAHSVGNPSSVHRAGRAQRARFDAARSTVARVLGAEPRSIIFTGSGSEANALALKGAFHGRSDRTRRTIISSSLEHPCVLGALEQLEAEGARVLRLAPDAHGQVQLSQLEAALDRDTALVSLMWVNNETGVLQPVAALSRLCAARGVLFHTDAVQALGRFPATLREVPADLLALSAHKLGGPVGVGALVVRPGVALAPLVPGHQEKGRRGGTQAVELAEALALALELAAAEAEATSAHLRALVDRFERGLLAKLAGCVVHGAQAPRAPGTSNVRVEGADGEALLIALDLEGICASAGAACASGSLTPSHVLTAMGLHSAQAQASLRFSFGRQSTFEEVDAVIAALVQHAPGARAVGER